MLKIFLDANIYFAGFHSKEGVSFLILQIAARKKFVVYSSRLVLKEAERNLRLKSKRAHLQSFHRYIQKTKIHVIPSPDQKFLESFSELIHPKDLPVLSAALAAKVDYLLTLDRRHFLTSTLESKIKKLKIMTPGDFLRQVYLKGKY